MKIKILLEEIATSLKGLGRGKAKNKAQPEFPNPRNYWTVAAYEPYTWTQEDIEAAQAVGWTNIKVQPADEYPYLAGVVSGNDPQGIGNWYLPKISHHRVPDETVKLIVSDT